MEESNHDAEMLYIGKENHRSDLEEKIKDMWKAIEDLRQKVTEEKELLQKEKSENARMLEEQVKLRRQLSMFHLPHCPAHSAPCPVHPFKPLHRHSIRQKSADNISEHQLHGDHVTQSYEELMQSLRPQTRGACEDLFREAETTPVPNQSQPSSFTLRLSDNWQCRQQEAEQSQPPSSIKDCSENFQFQNCEHQISAPSDVFNEL